MNRQNPRPVVTLENNTNIAELEEMIDVNIVKNTDGSYSCALCERNPVSKLNDMKRHVETHIEGLSFPCQSCDKTFRSRHSLRNHKYRYH